MLMKTLSRLEIHLLFNYVLVLTTVCVMNRTVHMLCSELCVLLEDSTRRHTITVLVNRIGSLLVLLVLKIRKI